MQTFDIPASKVKDAKNRVARANKRLKAAGITDTFAATYAPYTEVVTDKSGVSRSVDRVKMTLTRPVIGYEGFTFLGTVEEASPGNFVVYTAPGVELQGWRPSTMNCEHCNKKRARSKVYVVEDAQGGRKTVGKTCVELYTGMSPEGLFALEWDDVQRHHDDEWQKGDVSYGVPVFKADTVIQLAVHFVKLDGYKPTHHPASTKQCILDVLEANTQEAREKASRTLTAASQVDAAHYRTAMEQEYATSTSDWAMNVSSLLKSEWVAANNIGILASGVGPIVRNEVREEEEADLINEFYSYEGSQFDVAARVMEVKRVTGYGWDPDYFRITFHTDEGYVLTWKTSSRNLPDEGVHYMLFGRVKRHNEWKGRKTTQITRPSWVELT